jgi:hypothetical protein
MNGVATAGALGNIPTTFSIVQTGDYDGDGMSDLLWQDNLCNTSMWFMNGAAVASTGTLGNIPTVWIVQSVTPVVSSTLPIVLGPRKVLETGPDTCRAARASCEAKAAATRTGAKGVWRWPVPPVKPILAPAGLAAQMMDVRRGRRAARETQPGAIPWQSPHASWFPRTARTW